ncbi:nitroreductase family deazaflavin-dependent oxidoreductase [Streptomonospora salina]|uniref:Deazaflavin-dependent oxidoreductase (Nitroreductase family) n=1 Tax=Streptomonospora salina TaxID=104205 RepID=A0A841E020_9ACTN|nr:nitroreductase family deazaflavin-dependent oxidoreductase [Streptomonospora salina]MBB5996386.1 deazaflavin-dependent oxidoreductase (nitroreductase family) [Streptomonospora salina]
MLFGKEHVERYRATDGAEGHEWNGTTVLLLTTTGRNSGEPRTTPLIYRPDGGAYVVVASNGGAPDHPQWYKNLQADPQARVQVGAEEFGARARTAAPGEKSRLWSSMAEVWPQYDEYQKSTDRDIPVVLLEPVS